MRKKKVKDQEQQRHTPEQDLHDISIMEDNDFIMQVFTSPLRKQIRPHFLDGWVQDRDTSTSLQKYHSNMLENRSKISSSPLKDRNNSIKIERYSKMGMSAVLLDQHDCSFHSKRTQSQQLSSLLKLQNIRDIKPLSFPSQHIYLKKRTGVTSSCRSGPRKQKLPVQAVSYPIFEMLLINPEKRGSSIGKIRQLMQLKRPQQI